MHVQRMHHFRLSGAFVPNTARVFMEARGVVGIWWAHVNDITAKNYIADASNVTL